MPKIETLDFPDSKLIEMATWRYFSGFTATGCGSCRRTANVPMGPGWFCECGEYNILPWNNNFIPHEDPDMGPSRHRIVKAIKTAKGEMWWQKLWSNAVMAKKWLCHFRS